MKTEVERRTKPSLTDEQIVIREARQRQRRRRTLIGVSVLVAGSAVGLWFAFANGGEPPSTTGIHLGAPPASSLATSVLRNTATAQTAAFTFSWRTSVVKVRGSGTVNFVIPSYSIEETLSGPPILAGSIAVTRTPSGMFYQQSSGQAPQLTSGNGLTPTLNTSATGNGPISILSQSPAGYGFGLLKLIPAKDLRLLGVGTGYVGRTPATTYLFGDSGNCRGTVRTEIWITKDGRLLQVTTMQYGPQRRWIETMSLTVIHFGLPVSISTPSGAVGTTATTNTPTNKINSHGSSGAVEATPICTP